MALERRGRRGRSVCVWGADTGAGSPGLGLAVKGWSAAWERGGNIRELAVPAAGRGPGTGDTTEIQPKAGSLETGLGAALAGGWIRGWEEGPGWRLMEEQRGRPSL